MKEEQLRARLASMTLREKLLEMTQYNYTELGLNRTGDVTGVLGVSHMPQEELRSLGSLLNLPNGEEVMRYRALRNEMGLQEPVLVMRDVIHGFRTLYPIPLGLACSFDMQLIEDCARMAAIESKYDGIDVVFSPMVDLVRDPRWGRVMESAGEDPYLNGEAGKAMIRGYHKGGVACCVKHFAAYGAVEAGREYNTVDVSEHTLREYYLRAYRECMQENPEMFMSSLNVLNGIPAAANRRLFDVLRKEWGFDGVVISDWGSVEQLVTHGNASDRKECALAAIETRHDIEMCTECFRQCLPALIEQGAVDEQAVDAAVLRIMRLKNKLGMYENPDRYTDPKKRDEACCSTAHRALAGKAAEESIVLLKNDGVLPLAENANAAFVGPYCDTADIRGYWSASSRAADTVTVTCGVERLLGKPIAYKEGCAAGLLETDESGIEEAVTFAADAEVVVACVGEPRLNAGEHHSRADIRLPNVQRKLIERLKTLQKPLVLVVFGGRPQALKEVEPLADAILYAWQPGTEGGNAVANLLYGRANPSAKTAMSFPRSVGQCPVYYNHFNTGHPKPDDSVIVSDRNFGSCYDDEFNSPLYPFGYGLSYTSFAYSDLRLSADALQTGGKITASVRVKNTGDRDGKEVVQWYIRDKVASCVRPVKELKGFEKIFLRRGEERTVTFGIDENTLAFYTASGEYKAESGEFILFVGGNSRDCLRVAFDLREEM